MKKNILVTTALALVASSALATPTIYPKDVTLLSGLSNPTNSNLVADDSDPLVFWVMPPNTAYSTVGGLHSITANVGFCKEMANLQSYSHDMSAKMAELEKKQANSEEEINKILLKISASRQELSDFIVSKDLHNVNMIDERILSIETQITELNDRHTSCQSNCSEISAQLLELRKEKMALARERRDISKDKFRSVREMDQKKEALAGLEADLLNFEDRFNKLKLSLDNTRTRFLNMYSQFAKMEGARASINYESYWDRNIEELERANPGFMFKQIHTQNAVISTSLMAGNTLPGESAVLSYEISGNYENGKISYPSYPSNLSGNLRLSLIGACPVLHKDLFNINQQNGTDQMKYGMVISYEFPSSFSMDVTATYNMFKMYEKVVKSKKRGGFFSSSKKSSISEKTFFRDEFKVVWNEQDQANSLSEEAKADFEKELRDSIFGRLAVIGLPAVSNPGALVAEATDPNGAAVLATSMANNNSCKLNKWCTAATVGINVLNAVFGSSNSAASYTNIQDAELVERWSRTQVVYKPWISSYR